MCQQNNKLVEQHVSENMSTIEKRFWTSNWTNTDCQTTTPMR